MWELDHKENWLLKNWCFWTVVLEKTLESPLDCKGIQPVHSIGNQSWIFIGRTGAEAETPLLWPPDVKSWLIGKDPDAGEDWRWEEKGTTEEASPTPWTWVWISSGSWWWTGRPRVLQSMGLQRIGHDWATALNLVFSGSIRMFFWLSAPPPALPFQMLVPCPAVWQWLPLLTPREKSFSRCLWNVCYLSGLYQGWETVQKKDPVLVILKLTL